MTVSVILTSHMKPYLREALDSVLGQTRPADQVLVLDSAAWVGRYDDTSREMARIRADYGERVEWRSTGEPANLRDTHCPVAWVTNRAIRDGMVTGDMVCHFYDDDLYYPTFIERMAGYLETSDAPAVWCSQDRIRYPGAIEGVIRADGRRGPGEMDCRVDGAQVMYRRSLLDVIGDPWLSEDPGSCFHSDGLFLERLAAAAGAVEPVDEVLLAHRFTPLATYTHR